jgi:Carboxypeptidase regulatory-like domain/TonB-dependent Receptor Plug Domain/TonB dependent receptor
MEGSYQIYIRFTGEQRNRLYIETMSKKLCLLIAKVFIVCAPLFFCGLAHSQYDNGSLVGTIRDASGNPVPRAKVAITNTETGIVTEVTTNGTGEYDVPSLRVGTYKIVASASGFSDAEAENIGVSVGVRQHIDLSLKVGAATATVEVSGIALQLETETSERGQTVTNYESEALPLVSRNYSDLLALVPGSRQAPEEIFITSSNSLVRAGSFNVNGERSVFNNYLLDGIDNNAYGESNQGFDNQVIAVPPDSVAQFQIVTNNESAEYGRSSGATINVSSKSGTNQLHATIYEFLRNTVLNAPGFFQPTLIGNSGLSVPFEKPTFNRNQFGFNVGGPILKNRIFYFLDYEGFRQLLKTLTPLTLPTQNEINADLVVPVRNPITGVVYPANTPLPTAAINPLAAQILTYFKQISSLPASGLPTTGAATDDYSALVPFTDNSDKGDLRFDWQIAPTRSAFLRVSDRKEDAINFPSIPIPLDGQTNGHIRLLDQQVAVGFTQIFGATKILDARLGLDRTKAGKYNLSIGNTAFSTPGTPGYIPGLPSNPVVAGGLPSIGISGGYSAFGRQSTNPQWQDPAFLDPKLNFTWIKGSHSLKFGYEYQHLWMAVNDNNPLYGSFSYGGGYSVCPSGTSIPGVTGTCTGGSAVADNYWADFLFGTTSSYQLANYYEAHVTNNTHNLYAQDDWKVNNQLTLNLGLRWEYTSPYGDLYNRISNFDPTSQTVVTTTPGAATGNGITPVSPGGVYGQTLVDPDFRDYAPRVGFAVAPLANTAIRGGFGISYAHYTRAGSGDILAINAPQAQFASVTQPTPTPANHCASPLPAQIIATGTTTPSCYATSDQGFPSGLVTSFNSATDNITWVPKNTRDSYVESYFLSVQQQLGKNRVLDIAYVGNHGVHLQGFLNGNQENPALGASASTPKVGFARPFANWPSDITAALNEFWSNYNALQVKYEQRMVSGLTVLNSFTWEHSLDNASASLEGNTPSPQNGVNIAADYAQSDYNLPIANITTIVYDLPFGHGRQLLPEAKGLVNALLGDWQTSVINTAQAGTPFNITYTPNSVQAVSPQISATYRGANEYRPDRVAGVPVTQGTGHRASGTGYVNYVNFAAFVLPPIKDASGNQLSPFGTASRNPGRTPPFNETDFALNKKFNTPFQRVKIEFRAELYNIFNHTNYFLPSTISGTQGTTTQTLGVGGTPALSAITGGAPTSGGQISSTFEPRIAQFALKILY